MSKVTYQYKAGDRVLHNSTYTQRDTPGVVVEETHRDGIEAYIIDFSPRYGKAMLIKGDDLRAVRFADEQLNLQQFDLQDLT